MANTASLTPYKKGQSGNPAGVSKNVLLVRKLSHLGHLHFIQTMHKLADMTCAELTAWIGQPERTDFELGFARLLKQFGEGDTETIKIMFDRLYGKPKEQDFDLSTVPNHALNAEIQRRANEIQSAISA